MKNLVKQPKSRVGVIYVFAILTTLTILPANFKVPASGPDVSTLIRPTQGTPIGVTKRLSQEPNIADEPLSITPVSPDFKPTGYRMTDKPVIRPAGGASLFRTRLVADAGPAQSVEQGTEVFLDGVVRLVRTFLIFSIRERITPNTVRWEFLSDRGNVGVLFDSNTLNPHFKADSLGVYFLRLTGDATYTAASGGEVTTSFEDIVAVNVAQTINDLQICRIEVTQVTQTMSDGEEDICLGSATADNTVKLVKGKKTLVRVYVSLSGTPDAMLFDIAGRLRVFRNGTEVLPAPTLLTPNQTIVVQAPGPTADTRLNAFRAALPSTLNFVLDRSHTSGTVELRAEVNPSCKTKELDCGNNQKTATVIFNNTRGLKVGIVPIHYKRDGLDLRPNGADFDGMEAYVRHVYPFAEDEFDTEEFYPGIDVGYALNSDDAWEDLLQDIEDYTGCGNIFCDNDIVPHFYGVVPLGTPVNRNGMAELNSPFFSFLPDEPEPTAASIAAGEIMAQELAHNYGRRHACSGNGEDNCDGNYRPSGGMIGEFGFDFNSNTIKQPNTYDYMTYRYGDPNGIWVSPYTYNGFFNHFRSSSTAQSANPQVVPFSSSPAEYLLVSGSVSLNAGRLRPSSRIVRSGVPDPVSEGRFIVQLRDEVNNRTLFEWRFEPLSLDHSEAGEGTFRAYIPWQQGTTRILLKRRLGATAGDILLDSIAVSRNTPSVSFIDPAPGAELNGISLIRWSAFDADGDLLTTMIQYSTNGGQDWRPVAVSVKESHYQLDTSRMAGSNNALLRLLVTDGVNTGTAQAGPFIVPQKAPRASILRQTNELEFEAGTPVFLQGSASDPEDGSLSGDSLSWESDIDGPLGKGSLLQTSQLSPGIHTVSFRAQDSSGQVGLDSASVRILPVLPPVENVVLAIKARTEDAIVVNPDVGVTSVSRTIGAKAPLSTSFEQAVAVRVEASQQFQTGNKIYSFKEWMLGNSSTTSDREISLTLNNNTDLTAIYRLAFEVSCPPDVVKIVPSGQTSSIVNYPPPTVIGVGATVSCTPTSGSIFPLGTTTVNCNLVTTTGDTTNCSFTVTVLTFNLFLKDDSSGDELLLNTSTGDYQFIRCSPVNYTLSGRGMITIRGCSLTLQHAPTDRRVQAQINTCRASGIASVQVFALGTTFSITDRNITNNILCP